MEPSWFGPEVRLQNYQDKIEWINLFMDFGKAEKCKLTYLWNKKRKKVFILFIFFGEVIFLWGLTSTAKIKGIPKNPYPNTNSKSFSVLTELGLGLFRNNLLQNLVNQFHMGCKYCVKSSATTTNFSVILGHGIAQHSQ